MSLAKGGSQSVQVILAPFGLSATLTGVTYKSSDAHVAKLLQEWHRFYPLDRNRYTCQDDNGDVVTMAPAVEVIMAGVKMVYPTCYVLVTDLDSSYNATKKTMSFSDKNSLMTMMIPMTENHEPSPFTTSNHPLLSDVDLPSQIEVMTEQAWQDGLSINPESTLSASEQQSTQYHQIQGQDQTCELTTSDLVSAWDFGYPGRYVKKKSKSKIREKSSKDHRIRFNSKIPFHKKHESVDELTWTLDQADLLNSSAVHHNNQNNNNSEQGQGNQGAKSNAPSSAPTPQGPSKRAPTSLVSPANPGSVGCGPVTPVFTPKGSVRTPGGVDLLSPAAPQPASNGPLTPMDLGDGLKNPGTPRSVPSYPIPSPFESKKSVATPLQASNSTASNSNIKSEVLQRPVIKSEPLQDQPDSSSSEIQNQRPVALKMLMNPFKRPALPTKEYEEDLETENLNMSDLIYDTNSIRLWLNHPVKRFKPTDLKQNDPFRPAYRRLSQADAMLSGNPNEAVEFNEDASSFGVNVKQEPSSNLTMQQQQNNPGARFNNFANNNNLANNVANNGPNTAANDFGNDSVYDANNPDKRENGSAAKVIIKGRPKAGLYITTANFIFLILIFRTLTLSVCLQVKVFSLQSTTFKTFLTKTIAMRLRG